MKKKKLYIIKRASLWYKEGEIVMRLPKEKYVGSGNYWVIGADQQNVLDKNLERKNNRKDGTAIPKFDLIYLDTV